MASLPLIIAGKSIFDLLIPFTPKGKIARNRLKELEVIVAKEHQEIKNKIQEDLKAI